MLSGIQHFAFCRRQWALIDIEKVWEENLFTAKGRQMHENCHDAEFSETRKNVIISRAMPVYSRELGVSGECDVVEFRKSGDGIALFGYEGRYSVYPIEYKRGEPKADDCDALQLAAQAICLEEMLACEINRGALFYGKTKRRQEIEISVELKSRAANLLDEMHRLFKSGHIPRVKPTKRCQSCSLKEICLPKLYRLRDAKGYLKTALEKAGEDL